MKSKKAFKKILRGIAITIIVYITVSIIATKFIYDSIFERYTAENQQSILVETKMMFENEQDFSFKCGENNLKGMLYTDNSCENGLIIFTPGLNSEVIEYEGVIYLFIQKGFDVFAFNPTGHGDSGGDSSVGFSQIIPDLNAAIEFVNKNFDYNDIFLLGHSRGGYASCCVMNSYENITAVATVNSTDTAMDAIMAYSTEYIGGIAYGNYIFLDAYQNILFGKELSNCSSVKELNHSQTPVLVIQAESDEKIPLNKYSVYSKRDKITAKNVEFVLYNKEGNDGHTTILYGENRKPNVDIVNVISNFYKEKSNSKD